MIQVSGRHAAEDNSTLLGFRLRYTFRANEPGVLLSYKFTNREKRETGILLRSISLEIPTAIGDKTTKLVRQVNSGTEWFSRRHEIRENVEITAGEATSAEVKACYGAAAEGKVLIHNFQSHKENLVEYPYFLRPGNARTDMTGGLRPDVSISGRQRRKRFPSGLVLRNAKSLSQSDSLRAQHFFLIFGRLGRANFAGGAGKARNTTFIFP